MFLSSIMQNGFLYDIKGWVKGRREPMFFFFVLFFSSPFFLNI